MTIHSIAEKLYTYSEKLENGTLSGDEILTLTDLSREFYERMIVLRFKTVEESVENNSEPKFVEETHSESVSPPAVEAPAETVDEPIEEKPTENAEEAFKRTRG